jgi:pyrimidine deaminase RibD-like protein
MWCLALAFMAAAVEQTVAFAVLPTANLRLRPATTRKSVVEHAISKAPEEAVNFLEQDDENVDGRESFVEQNITNLSSSDTFEKQMNGMDVPKMDEGDVDDAVSNSAEEAIIVKGVLQMDEDVEEDMNGKDIPQLDDDLLFDRDDEGLVFDEEDEDAKFDIIQMRHAIQMAQSIGGERGAASPFPKPIAGAVIVAKDGRILGKGRSDYKEDCIRAAVRDAGLVATPLREWCVSWSSNRALREALETSTLYTTLEPSDRAQGEAMPPITQLIEQAGIPRVVIGCVDPIPERATEGAATLHSAGISVSMGVEQQDCERLIEQYAELANSKLQIMSRKFAERNGRVS